MKANEKVVFILVKEDFESVLSDMGINEESGYSREGMDAILEESMRRFDISDWSDHVRASIAETIGGTTFSV